MMSLIWVRTVYSIKAHCSMSNRLRGCSVAALFAQHRNSSGHDCVREFDALAVPVLACEVLRHGAARLLQNRVHKSSCRAPLSRKHTGLFACSPQLTPVLHEEKFSCGPHGSVCTLGLLQVEGVEERFERGWPLGPCCKISVQDGRQESVALGEDGTTPRLGHIIPR
jgi:hypothetical protein